MRVSSGNRLDYSPLNEVKLQISVIIPVVNEEASVGACLKQFEDADGVEVIVVDGGVVCSGITDTDAP